MAEIRVVPCADTMRGGFSVVYEDENPGHIEMARFYGLEAATWAHAFAQARRAEMRKAARHG